MWWGGGASGTQFDPVTGGGATIGDVSLNSNQQGAFFFFFFFSFLLRCCLCNSFPLCVKKHHLHTMIKVTGTLRHAGYFAAARPENTINFLEKFKKKQRGREGQRTPKVFLFFFLFSFFPSSQLQGHTYCYLPEGESLLCPS